jgi:hypothetical protein
MLLRFFMVKILGVPAKSGQALRYNLFAKDGQKGFSLQSFTQLTIKLKFNFISR